MLTFSPSESVRQDSALEILAKFFFHVVGKSAVVLLTRFGEKSLEMIRDDFIEDGFFGLVTLVATCAVGLERNGSKTHGANQGERRADG